MLQVKKVIQCCDYEYDVIVDYNGFELICDSTKAFIEGQKIEATLRAWLRDSQDCHECSLTTVYSKYSKFDAQVLLSRHQNYEIKKMASHYEYHITAKLIDKIERLVEVEGLLIEIEDIPGDIQKGDFVTFHTKLNLW